jgi:hypothetical protein
MVAHGLPGGSAHTAAEIRPPGRSTRSNSVMAPAMSGKNMKPNRQVIVSNEASPKGRSSTSHSRVSTLVSPRAVAFARAAASMPPDRSVSTTRPRGISAAIDSPGSPVPDAMSRCSLPSRNASAPIISAPTGASISMTRASHFIHPGEKRSHI